MSEEKIDPSKVLDLTHLKMTAADADWIRAARLQNAADKGDKEAAAKLKKLQETEVTKPSKEELDKFFGRVKGAEKK